MKKIFILSIVFLITNITVAQLRLRDAVYPYTLEEEQDTLKLHGMGIRKNITTDLYAGGLYTESKMTDPNEIINSEEDMGIRLIILSKKIDQKSIIKTFDKGFADATNNNTVPIQQEMATLMGLFETAVQKNDVFDFIYTNDRGLNVYKNGQVLGNVQGLAFKKTLFNIWLGEKPVCKYIKEGMLAVEG